MYRAILLLVATLLSISSYSQRVTKNLVQELYYVDGENYKVASYDSLTKSTVEIKLIVANILRENPSPYITFYIPIEGGYQLVNFSCELVKSSLNKPNPIVTCLNNKDVITVIESTKDSIKNTNTLKTLRYRFSSDINVFFLNELLNYPKELTYSDESIYKYEVQKSGSTTTTKLCKNGLLLSQSVSEEFKNGDKKESFAWVMNKKNELKKPYSAVSLIQYRDDSTIIFKTNKVLRYSKYSDISKHEKFVNINDSDGNLIFEGRYIGKRNRRKKRLEYTPEYEIEYKYYGKKLERRTIKTPTDTTLIEIRRKYAEPTQ